MKVFLAGGTGFVGGEILSQLTDAGHTCRCLVRRGSESKVPTIGSLEVHAGDATAPPTLENALSGCDAVINLIGVIREFPRRGVTFRRLHYEATLNLVEVAQKQGVKRFIQMSANGTRENASTPYHQTKWQAEQVIRTSGLDWTVFRPSMIFGAGDQFVNMLADMMRRMPIMPVVGDGRYRMSPVAVEDVAAGIVSALTMPDTIGRTYHCCGPDSLSYDEILDRIGHALGRGRVRKLHHPVFLLKPVVSLLESFPQFPLTNTQMTMLLEGNVCDPEQWASTFDLDPVSFDKGIKRYIHS